ncbi:hypothetical protein ACBJ59_26985 [Nonomuraea sp. MTCD27]|uniref:hypothetical protein n=1 Tax=Nonomuraea sp. MTCD27 TaxID=1676747 RepID=UPI0035BF28A0
MWVLIAAAETGFLWLRAAGKVPTGRIVIDVDATLITDHSDEAGRFGHLHPAPTISALVHSLS